MMPPGLFQRLSIRPVGHDDSAKNWTQRMIASTNESVTRFKKRLAAIKRRRRFMSRSEAGAFGHELTHLLDDLRHQGVSAEDGVNCILTFFEADSKLFAQCDDSSGHIGDAFRYAADVFKEFAHPYADKRGLARRLLSVTADDGYGVRDRLWELIESYNMSELDVMWIVNQLWARAGQRTAAADHCPELSDISIIAKATRNGPLYEKAMRTAFPRSPNFDVGIARVYFSAGDYKKALQLTRAVQPNGFRDDERRELLEDLYRAMGNDGELAKLLRENLELSRTKTNLEALLSVVGDNLRAQVLDEELRTIRSDPTFSSENAQFLLDVGQIEEAEAYVLEGREQLDGADYSALLQLAEDFEKSGQLLPCVAIYRALIESVLGRALSKYYHHAVKYLARQETLAPAIEDWRDLKDHKRYLAELREAHKRKSSLWKKYAGHIG